MSQLLPSNLGTTCQRQLTFGCCSSDVTGHENHDVLDLSSSHRVGSNVVDSFSSLLTYFRKSNEALIFQMCKIPRHHLTLHPELSSVHTEAQQWDKA